jgi:hypothetical protein
MFVAFAKFGKESVKKLLVHFLILVSSSNSEGTHPERLLKATSRFSKSVKNPSSVGILPENWFRQD